MSKVSSLTFALTPTGASPSLRVLIGTSEFTSANLSETYQDMLIS